MALRARPPLALQPILYGGGQQGGLRSGGAAVALAVGFASAAGEAMADDFAKSKRIQGLRDRLADGLTGFARTAPDAACLPQCLSVIGTQDADELLTRLGDRLACSTGAACGSARREPSPVLRAMGLSDPNIARSLRLSLGWSSTKRRWMRPFDC